MRIVIETIKHCDQRYSTAGDWKFVGDDLVIAVSDLGNKDYNFLLAIHELVEAMLCRAYRISQEAVDYWDMSHPELDEPGDHRDAPYHSQHVIAGFIEKGLALELGVNWDVYEKQIENLFDSRD